ncbi:hypothetical protein ACFCX4_08420 [Kitasatospora sp. NPDC056327]|uniref:hypothetical protein n=1 Tax=Kitasatospora sp. NPDC056327 TaxID=3345785 RepID=UPI0035D9551D
MSTNGSGPPPRGPGDPGRRKGVDLPYLTPAGRRRHATARFGPDPAGPARGVPRMRNTLLDGGVRCVQVRAAASDESGVTEAARDALDTEAAAALRLHRTFGDTEAARLFPVVIGYDLDVAEPFVLYRPPRGNPAERLHGLAGVQLRTIERDLVDAAALLAGLGLVHQGVTPSTVRWDGRSVQLWGLDAVVHTGRPRTPRGPAPYASPELRAGTGHSDPRDALWSTAQVMYRLVTGRTGDPDREPADLTDHRSLAHTMRSSFAVRAVDRPTPAALLGLLSPERGPAGGGALDGDGLAPHRAAFDHAVSLKRAAGGDPPGGPGADGGPRGYGAGSPGTAYGSAEEAPAEEPGGVLCPYCLEYIRFDPGALYAPDAVRELKPYAFSDNQNPRLLADELRGAFQLCSGNQGTPPHHIPVPYLTNGRPLTVAMIGQSNTGKSHLLTQMIAEIADDRLKPYGLSWQSVNPEQHASFLNDRVVPLRDGRVLDHTISLGDGGRARFVESLLITDARGRVRPLAFFDLAGEDLLRTDALLRFLLGIDALVFVVDPTLAMPLPQLDELRATLRLHVNRDGDPAFATALDRIPRTGPYLTVPSAIVVAKADLLRSEPPVDRWLTEPGTVPLSRRRLYEESRDVYALLHRHAGKAWLRPFDTALNCTMHIASATGGRQEDSRYPRGVRAQRVLEPLISLLAMHGIIELADGRADVEATR